MDYEYYLSRLPATGDRLLSPFRRKCRLQHVAQRIIDGLLSQYFAGQDLTVDRAALAAEWGDIPRNVFLAEFAVFFKREVRFDDTLQMNEPVSEESLNYRPFRSQFVENQHFFRSVSERAAGIEEQKSECYFELKPEF